MIALCFVPCRTSRWWLVIGPLPSMTGRLGRRGTRAINQPFTIWMMRSFFMNVPRELDESAMIDGCNRLQGFWHVIMPVMWPGVITTGLFSFLLAYNDFTVTSALLSQQNTTMVPRIAGFLGSAQNDGDQMAAVAAVVTATAPLFVLIMIFQRQLVSGLTAGAVKG